MFKNLSGRNMIRLLDEYTRSRYYREDTLAVQVAEEGQSNNHTQDEKSVAAAKAKREMNNLLNLIIEYNFTNHDWATR